MLHILLPVHNRAEITAGFLAAIQPQSYTDYRLVVIDDGCQDDTVDRVYRAIPPERVTVLKGDGNLWWAGALQLGYETLLEQSIPDDDAVLIINDDLTFDKDFLINGLRVLNEHPHAAIQAMGVDEKTRSIDRGTIADTRLLRFTPATLERPANCLSTRGLLMLAATFKNSGGFRPRWLPHYLSDYEYTIRLRRKGVVLICDTRFQVRVRLELTGFAEYPKTNLRTFWQQAFSHRSKYNPKHWTFFVFLVCPPSVIPYHIARIWTEFLLGALRASILFKYFQKQCRQGP